MEKIDLLRDRSEEVQEILGKAPSWPVLWGSVIVSIALISFAFLTWLIRYPDKIQAKIVLTTAVPPHHAIANMSGKILLLAPENSKVKRNDILCIIDNSSSSPDVLALSLRLDSIINNQHSVRQLAFAEKLALGELQEAYNKFLLDVNRLTVFNAYVPLEKEIHAIRHQIAQQRKLADQQARQKEIYVKKLKLITRDYERDKYLYTEKVIAAKDLDNKESLLLNASAEDEAINLTLTNNQIRLSELERELKSKEIQNQIQGQDLQIAVQESVYKLKSAIAAWEQKYVLRSPMAGRVSFFKFWTVNQFVNAGEEVIVVVPASAQEIIGKVQMPASNSGKVRIGQHVNIELDNYPYEEYGIIRGTVKSISLVPQNSTYLIDVSLPNGLETNNKNKIKFGQELRGNAEIVTEDLRLAERMFYQFRKIFKY